MRRPVILTIMCMAVDKDGKILVINRLKKDWPGLTFPGGHVEDDETCEEACVREMKEETGLEVSDLIEMGHIEWNNYFNVILSKHAPRHQNGAIFEQKKEANHAGAETKRG